MDGETFSFDFVYSAGDPPYCDPSVFIFQQREISLAEFPEAEKITADKLSKISEIKDFYVYTGEENKTDLRVVSIESVVFQLTNFDETFKNYFVDENVLKAYNATLSPNE